jgi:hypothetical protein
MKWFVKILLVCFFSISGYCETRAQSFEVKQLLLDCEKLAQLKNIYNDLVKGYEILSQGYKAVRDISKGNFDLHKVFLDGLMKANPVVQKYKKVADIIHYQLEIVSEYSTAYKRFKSDNNFSTDDISYIRKVYDNLLDRSIKSLSDLTNIVTDGVLRASDDERLNQIDKLESEMQDRLNFLRHFNNNTTILALQRAREKNDINTITTIYGVKN